MDRAQIEDVWFVPERRRSLKKYPSFETFVRKIIEQKRESTVNHDSVKNLHQVNQYYERANKDTFLENVLPMIIKPTRKVKSRFRGSALQPIEEVSKGRMGNGIPSMLMHWIHMERRWMKKGKEMVQSKG